MGVPADARPVATANARNTKAAKTSAHDFAARGAQSGATPSDRGPYRMRPTSAVTTNTNQTTTDATTPAVTALSTVVSAAVEDEDEDEEDDDVVLALEEEGEGEGDGEEEEDEDEADNVVPIETADVEQVHM